MNITLFCSSSNTLPPKYYEDAAKLGTFLGKNGYSLVFGGSKNGLMNAVAKAANEAGGHIIGFLPKQCEDKSSEYTDELIYVPSLNDRKEMLKEYADAYVALPGGIGTLDELTDILASKQIGFETKEKPIFIVNSNGEFDLFIQYIQYFKANKFGDVTSFFTEVKSIEECIEKINNL